MSTCLSAAVVTESVGLCSATNPSIVARAFLNAALREGAGYSVLHLESGGEDMPDAYLICPIREEDLSANIIELPPGAAGAERMFVIVYAMLFGFRSSVSNFTRFSVLLQVAGA